MSEREKAEAEVRELARGLEAKIRRLVEANVVGIVMWNLEGAITGANDAFLRMVQYDRDDLASGRVRWTDLTPAEWRGHDERAVADLKATGIVQPFEKEYFRKDGSRVPGTSRRRTLRRKWELLAGKPVKQSTHVYISDPLVPPVTLQGRITAGRFVSEDPRTGGLVVHRDIQLVFGPNASLTLPIQGLRLAFDLSADGSAVLKGQLTGSIKETDVRSQIIPALAATMTEFIKNDPTSPVTQNIQKLFDLGGCINPSGTAAQASDGVIDVCELLTSSLVMSLLQPDVQIYDAQGNYAPNPLHGNPDSMSIALGFSATVASY